MTPKDLVPKNELGNADWMAYVRTGWPMLLATLGMAFWLGGRMEAPEAKQARIDRALAPIWQILSDYQVTGGHPVMNQRVSALENIYKHLDEVEAEETEILREMKDAIVNYMERAGHGRGK